MDQFLIHDSGTYSDLMQGDCLERMKEIESGSVDLVVTSPPYDNLRSYNGNNSKWNNSVWENVITELHRVVKEGGVVVWVVADKCINGGESLTSFRQALKFSDVGFRLYDTMIWQKPSPQAPTEGRYYDVFEFMFIFSKGKPNVLNLLTDRKNKSAGSVSNKETRSCREDRKTTGEKRTVKEYSRRFNVWNISRGRNNTAHPAVFPIQIALDHILSWSAKNSLILDPFMGSGTTGVAAKNLGRNFVGIELDTDYFNIAAERIKHGTN